MWDQKGRSDAGEVVVGRKECMGDEGVGVEWLEEETIVQGVRWFMGSCGRFYSVLLWSTAEK